MINRYPVFIWVKRDLEYINIETEEEEYNENGNNTDSVEQEQDDDQEEQNNEAMELDHKQVNYITDEEQSREILTHV